jgi:chitodextrinase
MKTKIRSINRMLPIACCVISLSLISLFAVVWVKAQGTIIGLAPASYTAQEIGEEFSINITITNVQNLWSWKAGLTWDPNVLSLVGQPAEGSFLKSVGQTLFVAEPTKNGTIRETLQCQLYSDTGASGNGTLATLMFRINNETFLSPITLDNEVLLGPSSGGTHPNIEHEVENATVTLGAQGIRAIAGGDQTVNQGTSVTLNASKTMSQGEQNLTFTWTFFDRKPLTLMGMIVTYVFNIPGVYPVKLTVSDPEGRTSTDSITITVRDITPPVAVIALEGLSSNHETEVGQPILFNGTLSYDPENGTITSYVWSLGNGMTYFDSSFSYAYAQPGTYNVSLTVTEEWGNNNTSTVSITVLKANRPLSLFSDVGGILIAITVMVLIALPFWIDRARHRKTTNVARLTAENKQN